MKCNIEGLLFNATSKANKYYKYAVREELLGNLKELAKRYLAGDIKAVDEFLNLYGLDNKDKEDSK